MITRVKKKKFEKNLRKNLEVDRKTIYLCIRFRFKNEWKFYKTKRVL